VNSWLCCGYSVVENKNLVLLSSETARWTTTLRSRRKPGWSRTQTRTLLVSLLIKGGDVRICFITGRECPSVYHFRVRADNSLPEYLIVNNKQMAEPSTATQQNNISTKDSRVTIWTSSMDSWGSALLWHQHLLLPPCPSQWTGRRAMLAPPSPLQGSCLAVSRGSATLARLGIVDRIDQEESTTSQESNIYVIIYFLVLFTMT